MSTKLSLAFVLLLGAAAALVDRARADEPQAVQMACPRCGRVATTNFCGEDGTPLVRTDLIVFHRVISLLATGETRDPRFPNPFRGLLQKDGAIDATALERLVNDYAEARKRASFATYSGPMPVYPPAREGREASEAEAIAALRSIVAAQVELRDGFDGNPGRNAFGTLVGLAEARLVDKALASGRKDGWVFDAGPSTQDPVSSFYATAFPERPGPQRRFLYVNQTGRVHASREAFAVDRKTCNVPSGLVRVEERAPEPPVPETELEPVPGLDELRVGQVFVIRSNNGAPVTMKHRVTAKDEKHVTLAVLLEAPEVKEPEVDTMQLSLLRAKSTAKPLYAVLGRETLEISGTRFDCEVRESTNGAGKKERIWYCERRYPHTIKRQDDSGNTTWELIEIREP